MKMKKIRNILLFALMLLILDIGYASATICNSGWTKVDSNHCCPTGSSLSGSVCTISGESLCTKYGVRESQCTSTIKENLCHSYNSGVYSANAEVCQISSTKPFIATYTMTFYKNDSTSNPAIWGNDASGSYYKSSCSSEPCQIKSAPTISRNHYSFKGWSSSASCTSIANTLRFPVSITSNKTLYACWNQIAACYVCGNSSYGKYVYGTMAETSNCSYYSNDSKTVCEAKNSTPTAKQTVNDFTSSKDPTETQTETVTATILTYYKITYDLDGGHYIDGSTTRTQIVRGDKAVGDFTTNPVKDGYAFTEYQYNNTSFDFSKTLNEVAPNVTADSNGFKNITLKAVYAEYGDADLVYCEDEDAELDLKTQKCYTTLKEDASASTYTHTTLTYASGTRWCYAYNAGTSDGALHFVSGTTSTTTGKNNQTDGVYSGYSEDAWLSSNTCLIASACQQTNTWRDTTGCEIRWDAILYKVVDAKTKERTYTEETIDDDDSDDSDDLSSNIKTGDALIYVAGALGLGALGYTSYYFIKKKKESTI